MISNFPLRKYHRIDDRCTTAAAKRPDRARLTNRVEGEEMAALPMRVKVIVLGCANVGKTSLMKRCSRRGALGLLV